MDVRQDNFFDEISPSGEQVAPLNETKHEVAEVTLPFPQQDYNKQGELKKVRGRVLKKLLKSEWKHYALITGILMAWVLLMGLIFGIVSRATLTDSEGYYENSGELLLSLLTTLLFVFTCSGAVLFAQIYPVARYNKNFFQNEGYLTFSIPASMEEHVFAKRIAAVLCSLGMFLSVALASVLAILISGGLYEMGEEISFYIEIFSEFGFSSTGEGVLSVIESIISGIIGLFLLPAAYGAMSCALSKSSGNKKTFTVLILVFLGVGVAESILSSVLVYGTELLSATVVGRHIASWLGILLQAGLTVGCTAFEIFYLKRKMDLK